MDDTIPELRVELWRAFADGGEVPEYWSGPADAHWTAAVDRLLAAAAPMLGPAAFAAGVQAGREAAAADILAYAAKVQHVFRMSPSDYLHASRIAREGNQEGSDG